MTFLASFISLMTVRLFVFVKAIVAASVIIRFSSATTKVVIGISIIIKTANHIDFVAIITVGSFAALSFDADDIELDGAGLFGVLRLRWECYRVFHPGRRVLAEGCRFYLFC